MDVPWLISEFSGVGNGKVSSLPVLLSGNYITPT